MKLTPLLTLLCAQLSAFAAAGLYSNPVLPGDFPDPSVIRTGSDFWATATSSEWAPLFPLLHSKDLVNWEVRANVFQKRPDWAVGNFWAPEITHWNNRYYVYYVGRKKGGPLSIAVATADKPEGPYTDHGPMISQPAGSIDPVLVPNEKGEPYLIWKEDGNSRKQPTVLWAQPLSPDGTKLVGEMKELFRNDAAWEGNVVEGPFVVRRKDYFYLFYSGNACCGRGCHYGFGVARAKNLLGPWEKNPANPILAENAEWRCPGHGSIVNDGQGRDFLLYHAYDAKDFIYVGRQGLLDEITWTQDGWATLNNAKGPSSKAALPFKRSPQKPALQFVDEFTGSHLAPSWQWPQSMDPTAVTKTGRLWLSSSESKTEDPVSSVVAVLTRSGEYEASTQIPLTELKPGVMAGLSAFGDSQNALGVYVQDRKLVIWKRQRNQHQVLGTLPVPPGDRLTLRVSAKNGHRFLFSTSGNDKDWQSAGSAIDLEGEYLPPWDRGIRIALTSNGMRDNPAVFEYLKLFPSAVK
jgi:xylan 1,4-beta-xylosidase